MRQTTIKEGVPFPQPVENTADPLDILRYLASVGDHLASRVEAQLTELETAAIVSANSSAAIHAYLAMHDLASQLAIGAVRTGPDPLILPPSPHLINCAAAALNAPPAECAVISGTPHDIRAAGAPSIAYAKTTNDAEHQVDTGASAFVYSMADIALRLRARAVDGGAVDGDLILVKRCGHAGSRWGLAGRISLSAARLEVVRRQLTTRERAVLDALLLVEFDGAEDLRRQAKTAVVVGGCDCGCPSIDFHNESGIGMQVRVNAAIEGTYDGLFLYTVGGQLGGIEWVAASEGGDPAEFPDPGVLTIRPA